jgi:hypothetical protein
VRIARRELMDVVAVHESFTHTDVLEVSTAGGT